MALKHVSTRAGAAMWMQPHLVILDEPTNYLDRESLGALADAIREFEGGVVIISHNNDFTTALCPETWVVEKDEDEVRSRRPVVWSHAIDVVSGSDGRGWSLLRV